MRNHNKEKNSFAFNSVFCLIWSWEREKKGKENQDAIVFSWTLKCSKAGNEMFDLFLCVLKCSIDTQRENMNTAMESSRISAGQIKDTGSNIAIEMTSLWHKTPLLHSYAEFSDRTVSITSE